jgi:hypothetical protein
VLEHRIKKEAIRKRLITHHTKIALWKSNNTSLATITSGVWTFSLSSRFLSGKLRLDCAIVNLAKPRQHLKYRTNTIGKALVLLVIQTSVTQPIRNQDKQAQSENNKARRGGDSSPEFIEKLFSQNPATIKQENSNNTTVIASRPKGPRAPTDDNISLTLNWAFFGSALGSICIICRGRGLPELPRATKFAVCELRKNTIGR